MDDRLTIIVLYVVTIYLVVLVIRDWRRKDFFWWALSATAAVAMLLVPLARDTVTVEVPASR